MSFDLQQYKLHAYGHISQTQRHTVPAHCSWICKLLYMCV